MWLHCKLDHWLFSLRVNFGVIMCYTHRFELKTVSQKMWSESQIKLWIYITTQDIFLVYPKILNQLFKSYKWSWNRAGTQFVCFFFSSPIVCLWVSSSSSATKINREKWVFHSFLLQWFRAAIFDSPGIVFERLRYQFFFLAKIFSKSCAPNSYELIFYKPTKHRRVESQLIICFLFVVWFQVFKAD